MTIRCPPHGALGIDSGTALAVNNGRPGHREPLFFGQPANHAAKRAGGGNEPEFTSPTRRGRRSA